MECHIDSEERLATWNLQERSQFAIQYSTVLLGLSCELNVTPLIEEDPNYQLIKRPGAIDQRNISTQTQ